MLNTGTPADHCARLERARLSLDGLSVGDAFGERFFVPPTTAASMVEQRTTPLGPWNYTDDTEMALPSGRTGVGHRYRRGGGLGVPVEGDAFTRLAAS
ncbi:hypothetical protein [Archangium lansingense]|uniref:Uncharacterized protein n=1 Tax=Archangium lansingense TaxID=2995310 RepID=A0ABT4A6R8_9BACT|nr:hypothetical protein [Archangium lansinium]MCY1077342.1 hypothetical protein [Archangium lansinium]